jgi:hypothetical protein
VVGVVNHGGQKMTVADWIRSRSDMELAVFLTELISKRDHLMSEKLAEQGISNSLIEVPELSVLNNLTYLRQPMDI